MQSLSKKKQNQRKEQVKPKIKDKNEALTDLHLQPRNSSTNGQSCDFKSSSE